jgi:hypothetical protein
VLVGAEEASQVTVDADDLWLKTLFAITGGSLRHSDAVIGLAIEKKKDKRTGEPRDAQWCYRLSLWVKNAADLEFQGALGSHLRSLLDLPEESIAFCSFRKEDRDNNPRITI